MAAPIAAWSPLGTSSPVTPGATISGLPPTSVTSAGRSESMASSSVTEVPSESEAIAKRSLAA